MPSILVVIAHVFCHASCFLPCSSRNVMSKAFAKFCPSKCASGPCAVFPLGNRYSMLWLAIAPANFSASLFLPATPFRASSSSVTSVQSCMMSLISFSASSFVSNCVCPSHHRNSLVLMSGVGCLNSHLTTLFHWLYFTGKSLQLLIHFE